jgi:hypothetical protein
MICFTSKIINVFRERWINFVKFIANMKMLAPQMVVLMVIFWTKKLKNASNFL